MKKKYFLGLIFTLGIMSSCVATNLTPLDNTIPQSTNSPSINTPNSNSPSTSSPDKSTITNDKKVVPSETPSSAMPKKDVNFTIQVDKKTLSNKRDIEVRLYNEEQIKILEKTSQCTVSFDTTTKKEITNCPTGVVYQKSEPEVFKFKLDEIKDNISIKSTSVKTNQKFLLTISGLSSDGCNTASARIEKSNASENENLKDLQWASTLMACLN